MRKSQPSAQTAKYQAANASYTLNVAKKALPVPTLESTLSYNGEEQEPSFNITDRELIGWNGDGKGTDAGTYTAIFFLRDTANTEWAVDRDKQVDQKVAWTIEKAENLELSGSAVLKNEEGATTTTKTDKITGTVTETTKYTEGATQVVETKKDGTVTTTVEKTDGSKVVTEQSAKGDVSAEVTLPANSKETVITLPIDPANGDVVVLVHADGTEEVLRKSVPTDDGLAFVIDGSATVKVVNKSKTFDDVPSGHWAAKQIEFVTSRNLYQGIGDNKFAPGHSMTRGMLAQVLHNLENNPTHNDAVSFPDATGNHWATEAVLWAAENDIVKGMPDGSYGVDANISRQDLAVILWRYVGSPVGQRSLDTFGDADAISGYANAALQWITEAGIMSGKPGGLLDPKGNATRAEVASMMMRLMQFQMQ